MKPKSGDTVLVHHRVTTDQGNEIESSFDETPLRFTVDSWRVLKGMNEAVKELDVGEKKTVHLSAANAHGEYDPSKKRRFRKTTFYRGLKVGQTVTFQGDLGEPRPVRVVDEDDECYTMDMNHPLAGVALTLEIELLEVQESERSEHGI